LSRFRGRYEVGISRQTLRTNPQRGVPQAQLLVPDIGSRAVPDLLSSYDMQPFPHRYEVSARASAEGDVTLESYQLPALKSASPAEFGGPGDRWSPETLLVGAVADCF